MGSLRAYVMAACAFGLLLGLAGCEASADRPAEVFFPTSSEAGEIALRFEGHGEAALVVPVYINGEGPFDFLLDTGATMTCVEASLSETLGLRSKPHAEIFGAGIGGAGALKMVQIDSLKVGEASASQLGACVLDLEHMKAVGVRIQGLVGLNFLRSFHVALDFRNDVLTLTEP